MRSVRIRPALPAIALIAALAHAQSVKILVQSSPLAGFKYYAGEALWDRLKVGDALVLIREPDNPHDGNAVRIEWRGVMLGYLPRAENRTVAAEMDRGTRIEGRVAALVKHRDPWKRLRVEVLAVD